MSKNVLITGGTGLVGSRLTELLFNKGYNVSYLSRSKKEDPNIDYYVWDTSKGYIEDGAIEKADFIVHLAGTNVADKRWTDQQKKKILKSRIQTATLLAEKIQTSSHKPEAFISASAVGYYGHTNNVLMQESAKPGKDFLAEVCVAWENAADLIAQQGIRTAKIRVGIVLAKNGGALDKMSTTARFLMGAPLGNGKQYLSWIHIDDLANMFIHAIENPNMEGPYNGVAPNPVTNEEMTKAIGETLHRPVILPNVPSFALKLMMGEMAEMLLHGTKASSEKIEKAGFQFLYPELKPALMKLLR
ncbi:TIGR01777 family oxidoreductase [Limibacter armeniacum]|uniref:TIGR01777 family oxidoreductase n=1 Tax=Limibacter armeniacum TaxID=466084 RepID=UPI002FE61597